MGGQETGGTTPHRYTAELANAIEVRWQKRWEELGVFYTPNPVGNLADTTSAEKVYILDMFSYSSGKGLHVGHPFGYIVTDMIARYQRMLDKNVLYTMGFNAFGLPAEQYVVQTDQYSRVTTEQSIVSMRRQLRRIEFSHDSRRTFVTTDVGYVCWMQWIFLQIYNSWYDPGTPCQGGRSKGSARPISKLHDEFDARKRRLDDGREWAELNEGEKGKVLDSRRPAYISEAPVNWCLDSGTVLANEEVTTDGRSERGNLPVFKRNLRQWVTCITAHANRLAGDLDTVDWPEKIRLVRRHWIGHPEGVSVEFDVSGVGRKLEVYTTRPDTLSGTALMAVAPEHPILGNGVPGNEANQSCLNVPASWPEGTNPLWTGGAATLVGAAVEHRAAAAAKSETERLDDERVKMGVFTGLFGVNPVNGKQIPILVTDYVLMGYGTGAVMAVPVHDLRDWESAHVYGPDVVRAIEPAEDPYDSDLERAVYGGEGVAVDSANDSISLDGLSKDETKVVMTAWLELTGAGRATVTHRLRDWLFSHQRYQGKPFPIVWDEEGCPRAFPEDCLFVGLPEISDYSPRTFDPEDVGSSPEPPLGRAEEWLDAELDLGDGFKRYRRGTNTMPQQAGSYWYKLCYIDPHDEVEFVGPTNEAYWAGLRPDAENVTGGADLYVGGVEHAVLHLLYARFWHRVLLDLGCVSSSELFHKLLNQGYVQAYTYTDVRDQYAPAEEVVEAGTDENDETSYAWKGEPVSREYGKMGKSLKNIATPNEICDDYGADTFRLYEMSMGSLGIPCPWEMRAVVGSQHFLQRPWHNVINEQTGEVTVADVPVDGETAKPPARTIADVRNDYDGMWINTATAKMVVLNNHLTPLAKVPREATESLVLMVSPAAPHIAEELQGKFGHGSSLADAPFPEVGNESLFADESVTCVVQVKGKARDCLEVSADVPENDLVQYALASEWIAKFLDGEPCKVITRASGLVNIVS